MADTMATCSFCQMAVKCKAAGCSGKNEEGHIHTCETCMKYPQLRQLFVRIEALENTLKALIDRWGAPDMAV